MWNCKHCTNTFEFNKTADKANHSRWCAANPNISNYKNNPKLATAVQESKDKKHGKRSQFNVCCNKCGENFLVTEREKTFPLKEKYFCSRSCSNSHVVTSDHRKKTSESLTGKPYIAPYEMSKECENCKIGFKFIKHPARKENRFCSQSCSSILTLQNRNQELRKNRPEFINYRADCAFRFNLNDYPTEFNFAAITEHGWYKPKNRGNNLTGISRDHMVSVRYGFDNAIPAEHLAHPANCRLLQHGRNVSKGTKNSITYDELLIKIEQWNAKYK